MHRNLSWRTPIGTVVALCLLAGACGRVATTAPTAGAPPRTLPSSSPRESSSSTSTPSDDRDHTVDGALTPARRAQLGLSSPTGNLQPATPQQWADPQAVAARFVLADTTYAATEDPAVVNARRAAYATERFGADLNTSSSGAARLDELRHRQARFSGEVLAITTSEASAELSVVDVSAAVTLTTTDEPAERRVRFYQLTLGWDSPTRRWLVARAEQS